MPQLLTFRFNMHKLPSTVHAYRSDREFGWITL